MTSLGLIVAGAVIALLALARRPWHVRIRNVHGNTVVGNVEGGVIQTYQGGAPAAPDKPAGIGAAQVITWLIALAGVIIAAIGVYINATKP
jgi:hypothetical protein